MDSIGQPYGKPVHGEVSTADASLGVSFVIYDAEGVVVTIASNQRLVLESGLAVCAAAGVQVITPSTDAAGKRLRRGSFAANSGLTFADVRLWCPKGVTPKFFGPVGQADCQIEGRLIGS
jgi:hypothetical protein